MGWEQAASGYAAVWATENTRAAIWDGMKRKETYATTGPRMTVRFFGGWDFVAADADGDVAAAGYDKGVPMGGDLEAAVCRQGADVPRSREQGPGRRQPRPDPGRQGLGRRRRRAPGEGLRRRLVGRSRSRRRRQAARGGQHRRPRHCDVHEYASATRNWRPPGRIPTSIPALRAVYYARVLEIPTPRWMAYDAVRFKVEMPDEVRMITQERAYTSPIWYTP